MGVVGNRQWIENIANFITAHLLVNCHTASERGQLLNILSEANFASTFHHKSSQLVGFSPRVKE